MNKHELQKKYQEIILNTNGSSDDYALALCQIANAINELDEPKQETKWQKLKEWLEEKKSWNERQLKEAPINTEFYIRVSVQGITINKILDKMRELEAEDVED